MQRQKQEESVLRNCDSEGERVPTGKPEPRSSSWSADPQYGASIVKG